MNDPSQALVDSIAIAGCTIIAWRGNMHQADLASCVGASCTCTCLVVAVLMRALCFEVSRCSTICKSGASLPDIATMAATSQQVGQQQLQQAAVARATSRHVGHRVHKHTPVTKALSEAAKGAALCTKQTLNLLLAGHVDGVQRSLRR